MAKPNEDYPDCEDCTKKAYCTYHQGFEDGYEAGIEAESIFVQGYSKGWEDLSEKWDSMLTDLKVKLDIE